MKSVLISSFIDSGKICLNKQYAESMYNIGILPVIAPTLDFRDSEVVTKEQFDEIKNITNEFCDKHDILLLSGGSDINPILFNDTNANSYGCHTPRDLFEFYLLKSFIDKEKPILGICRGFQLIGRALNLYHFQQHLKSDTGELHNGNSNELKSRVEPSHSVFLKGSLYDYVRSQGIIVDNTIGVPVNSWHHQGFTFDLNGKSSSKIEREKVINDYAQRGIEIILHTRSVIEGFSAEKRIVAFQHHPEEYKNSIFLKYFKDYCGI